MSLSTDTIFIKALSWAPDGGSEKSVLDVIRGRLYGTAIPLPEEDLDNEPLPYAVVTFNGLTNDGLSKDNTYEGDGDRVQIGVTVAAATLDELHTLTTLIRRRVRDYFSEADDEQVPSGYQFTAGSISYDSMKPCYWQTLNYDCDTYTD